MESRPEMQFQRRERDIVLMQHVLEYTTRVAAAEGEDGAAARAAGLDGPRTVRMRHTSSLVEFKGADASAMARTVGLPVAIATQLILDGAIVRTGVARPTSRDIWGPILNLLEEEGVHVRESHAVLEVRS
jgi:alpha-aminoadipic semialdehyde synthase